MSLKLTLLFCAVGLLLVAGTNGFNTTPAPGVHVDSQFPHLRPNYVIKCVTDLLDKGARDENNLPPTLTAPDKVQGNIACHVRNAVGQGTGKARLGWLGQKADQIYESARTGRVLADDYRFSN